MANTVNGSTYELDTAAEVVARGVGGVWIRRLEWHPNATDDDLDLEDGGQKETIWKLRALAGAANNESYGVETKVFDPPKWFDGMYLTTIDGGTLYVEVE